MSPRRNRPRNAAGGGGDSGFMPRAYSERRESWRGEDWLVRSVGGGAGGKSYRCPGCDQEVAGPTPHVVAWPEHAGADDRRHWHTACWSARERRGARDLRPGRAPRY
ncbi:ATP/GTP-binding protein [Streptomyces sp. A7024]|uniref:ATP/GTP-binding protein n=1 Tax=Streptomyces coryli TaxID=1128680 RepID=A0A6G4UAN4_9ACTN|nr:ATP/GTP-binding protein [Streptomyces coryli]NGN68251.1 ATP/GTP-binding protein [Streptomyces coryli]